jgi:hypothetical protein
MYWFAACPLIEFALESPEDSPNVAEFVDPDGIYHLLPQAVFFTLLLNRKSVVYLTRMTKLIDQRKGKDVEEKGDLFGRSLCLSKD